MSGIIDTLKDTVNDTLSSITQGLRAKPKSVVGIDIGSSAIKAVQLKMEKGKIVLETYGSVATGPYNNMQIGELPNLSADQIRDAIQELLKEANVTTTSAAISIRSGASLVFVLELPTLPENQYASVVQNEARKYIPVPITEVSLDWWIIPHDDTYQSDKESDTKPGQREMTRVLVVAVQNDVVTQYQEILKESKITSGFFEVEIFSAMRSALTREYAPVMIIDMGASSTRIAVVDGGVVQTFHTVNRGAHYMSESIAQSRSLSFEKAEKIKKEVGLNGQGEDEEISNILKAGLGFIFSEINNVLFSYEREHHHAIQKIILVGGGSRLNGFKELAEETLQTTVVHSDPFGKAQTPQFLENVLTQVGPEFSIALGLALKQLSS